MKNAIEEIAEEFEYTNGKYGFIKGYEAAIKNLYNVAQLKECYQDAQEEMRKCFSSSYVSKTFEQWLEDKIGKNLKTKN